MKRRIGLVTWNGSYNYGTNLQAYALYRSLNNLGHEVSMISGFSFEEHTIKGFLNSRYVRVKRFLQRIPESPLYGHEPVKMEKINQYLRDHFHYTTPAQSKRAFKKSLMPFEVLMTGSDQIWNPHYLQLFFMVPEAPRNARRVAYATSIGVNFIPESKKKLYYKHLSRFYSISIREAAGAKLISEITGKNIPVVLDPTLLLNARDWREFYKSTDYKRKHQEAFILCYFVGENNSVWEGVEVLRKKTGINNVIVIPLEDSHYKSHYELILDAGPADFVRLIDESTLVCTDSYHAAAICINLKKDFITFLRFKPEDPASQNSRITELLEKFKLNDRLFDNSKEMNYLNTDYREAEEIIESEREKSFLFLSKSIL